MDSSSSPLERSQWTARDLWSVNVVSTGKESSATVTERAPLSARPRRKPVPL